MHSTCILIILLKNIHSHGGPGYTSIFSYEVLLLLFFNSKNLKYEFKGKARWYSDKNIPHLHMTSDVLPDSSDLSSIYGLTTLKLYDFFIGSWKWIVRSWTSTLTYNGDHSGKGINWISYIRKKEAIVLQLNI